MPELSTECVDYDLIGIAIREVRERRGETLLTVAVRAGRGQVDAVGDRERQAQAGHRGPASICAAPSAPVAASIGDAG
jgi:hypothetical protein